MQSTFIDTTLQQAVESVRRNIPRFGDQYPHNGDGLNYVLTDNNHWMTSFWPGQLWLAYPVTGDETFAAKPSGGCPVFDSACPPHRRKP